MTAGSFPAEDRPDRLSESDAETVAIYLSELSAAQLPLGPGLRAAAEEAGGAVAGCLRSLADALDRGRTLDEALQTSAVGFPHYLQGLVTAALRTGELGEALVELVEHRRTARRQQRAVLAALAYPTLLLGLTGILFLVLAGLLGPMMTSLIDDFEMSAPVASLLFVWIGHHGIAPLVAGLAVVLVGIVSFRLFARRAVWDWTVSVVPLLGPIWRWSAVAEMARLMSSLVGRGVPLPEALRLTSAGVSNAHLADVCRELAAGVEQGRELASLVIVSPWLPASLAPIIRWGQRTGQLDEAFASAAEMLEGRMRLRAALLRAIAPPVVLFIVAVFALAIFLGFFIPLVNAIQYFI